MSSANKTLHAEASYHIQLNHSPADFLADANFALQGITWVLS